MHQSTVETVLDAFPDLVQDPKASFETVRLTEDRRYTAAALNGIGTLIIGTGAAAVGLIVGLAL